MVHYLFYGLGRVSTFYIEKIQNLGESLFYLACSLKWCVVCNESLNNIVIKKNNKCNDTTLSIPSLNGFEVN